MKKVIYEVPQSEKDRIIQMHESATKKQYVKILEEESKPAIGTRALNFLKSDTEEYQQSVGSIKKPEGLVELPLTKDDVDYVVDLLDDKKTDEFIKWINGETTTYTNEPIRKPIKNVALKNRYLKVGSLYYPAVEQLRVEYNIDEYFETLYSEIFTLDNVVSTDLLIDCYKNWIGRVLEPKEVEKEKKEKEHEKEVIQKTKDSLNLKNIDTTKISQEKIEKNKEKSGEVKKDVVNNDVKKTDDAKKQTKTYVTGNQGFFEFCKDKNLKCVGKNSGSGFYETEDGKEYEFKSGNFIESN